MVQYTQEPDQVTQFPELKVLNYAHIKRIDDLLHRLGSFGELRLIKRKGALRFIETVESIDLYQDMPSSVRAE